MTYSKICHGVKKKKTFGQKVLFSLKRSRTAGSDYLCLHALVLQVETVLSSPFTSQASKLWRKRCFFFLSVCCRIVNVRVPLDAVLSGNINETRALRVINTQKPEREVRGSLLNPVCIKCDPTGLRVHSRFKYPHVSTSFMKWEYLW